MKIENDFQKRKPAEADFLIYIWVIKIISKYPRYIER